MNIIKWFKGLYQAGVNMAQTPSISQVRQHLEETSPKVVVRDGKQVVVLEVKDVPELERLMAVADHTDPAQSSAFADGVLVGYNYAKQSVLTMKRSAVRAQSRVVKAKLAEKKKAAKAATAETEAAARCEQQLNELQPRAL